MNRQRSNNDNTSLNRPINILSIFSFFSSVVGLLEGLLSELSDEEKDDIFYNNAKKFYNIE